MIWLSAKELFRNFYIKKIYFTTFRIIKKSGFDLHEWIGEFEKN